MKKLVALLLAVLLLLSLYACGSTGQGGADEPESTTLEETELDVDGMLAVSKPLSMISMGKEVNSNKARALNEYQGNVYTIWGIISEINADSADLRASVSNGIRIRAYLPSDELIKLNVNDVIQVVGIIADLQEETEQVSSYTFTHNVWSLDNARYVTDVYTLKNATIKDISYNRSSYSYTCEISDENFGTIYLKSGKITDNQWKNCEKYTLSATGKICMEVVYGFELSPLMESDDITVKSK